MSIDKKTILACIDGNQDAQAVIFEEYAAKMLGVCYRYSGNIDDAEDVMQQTFIYIFKNMHQFGFENELESWLKDQMVKHSVDYLLKDKNLAQDMDMMPAEHATYEQIESDAVIQAKEMIETLKSLPVAFRLVINLYSIESYSHQQISALLDIPEHMSRSLYARARMLLARILNAKGRIQSINNDIVTI